MINFPLESDVRIQVNERLKNLGWKLTGQQKNVFFEQPKTEVEKRKLKGKRPDYVLYENDNNVPLVVIETKKTGENIDKALVQGTQYAELLEAPIVFATDGVFYKSLHTKTLKPLILNGEEVDELIREFLAIQYLQKGTNEVYTIPKEVQFSRQELINIFNEANDTLRVEGLRAGIERFSEFANILFLKLLSEIDDLKEVNELDRKIKWDFYKNKPSDEILDYVNNIVLPRISFQYKDENIFSPLQIKDGRVLKKIIDKLDPLVLTDINSDIKGDAFEYFLKATSATGNDLGEYFTPRHIVKMMVKLVNPQIGEKIYDPFCGTGGLLIESFRHIYNTMPRNSRTIKQLKTDTIFGNEITNTARITKMNMILAGDGHSNIQMKNSLADPSSVENEYDVVLTNMPYSQTTDYGVFYDIPTKNGDSVCIQHCIKALDGLSENGRMAIIVPECFLFRKDLQKTREYLMSMSNVQSVISLPQGVFLPYTGVKTNVLFLKNIKKTIKNSKTWFFEIKNDGYSLDSQRKKIGGDNDIEKFLAYRKTENQNETDLLSVGFHAIDRKAIIENDCILSFNRYKSFIELSSEWEFISLGDESYFKIESGGTPDTQNPAYWNGEIAWATLADLPSQDIFSEVTVTKRTITQKGLEDSAAKLLPVNSVLVSSRATIGRVAINRIPVATNQGFKNIIIINQEAVLPEFVALMMTKLAPVMEQVASGATFKEISKGEFVKLKIPVPPMLLQRKIVSTAQNNINEVLKKQREIETLKGQIFNEIDGFWQ